MTAEERAEELATDIACEASAQLGPAVMPADGSYGDRAEWVREYAYKRLRDAQGPVPQEGDKEER